MQHAVAWEVGWFNASLPAFLAEFGVKRVRDLKASDVAKAKQALDRLEAAMRAADDEDDSIDPFA